MSRTPCRSDPSACSLAYETGLAATAYADAGITAPALLGSGTRPDGGIELWLADRGSPA